MSLKEARKIPRFGTGFSNAQSQLPPACMPVISLSGVAFGDCERAHGDGRDRVGKGAFE
jgi:hypothetical protein